jgi:alpha-tubulin suppressor-like RCC1 family protein
MAAIGGCTPIADAFRCTDSAACVREGVAGTCEASQFCSFPDAMCDSGRRYGEFAGDGLSGLCVTAADSCGALGEACCAGTNTCQTGLTCTAGSCVGCVAALAVGYAHACALRTDGSVACWGANDHGQIGNGASGGPVAVATPVVDDHGVPLAGIRAIAVGDNHSCALRPDKTVVCWGDDSTGQLGGGDSSTASVNPVPKPAALTTIAAIAAGARHTCAALDDASVWCWGGNEEGQLGTAPSQGTSSPTEVVDKSGAPIFAASLTAGATHTCAVGRDHRLVCWGTDTAGELGDGTSAATSLPVAAASLGTHVVAAAAGNHFSCVLGDDAHVSCFGANDGGQAGQPASTNVLVPTAVAIDLATAVAAGSSSGCARRGGGGLQCWGPQVGAPGSVVDVREGVGAIAVGADICSARGDGVDCVGFGDPHLACP